MNVIATPLQSSADADPPIRLALTLLGGMRARDGQGRDVLPRHRKTRGLLAVIALCAPTPVRRQTLMSLFWSGRAPEQARGSLRQCLHELHLLLLPLGPLLTIDRHQVSLRREALSLDAIAPVAEPEQLLTDLTGLDPAFDRWIEGARRRLAAPTPRSPPPGIRRIRVGVPPFRGAEGNAEDPLSLGLADEITTALSRFRWMFLVASTSLAALPGDPREAKIQWQELDLDFVLEGSIQRGADRLRVTVRLLDMRAGGELVWAERFDPLATDLLSLQDEIAAKTVAQLDPALMQREALRAASRPANSLTAYDLVLRAVPAIYRLERSTFLAAGEALTEAISLDPDYAAAHSWLACWHMFLQGQGWAADRAAAMVLAGECAERAMQLDPSDARSFAVAGHVQAFLYKRVPAAMALHRRALALNPNLPLAWVLSGLAFTYAGDPTEAIRRISRARVLSPFDPHGFFFDMSLMIPHLQRGDYERVVELGQTALALNPSFTSTYKGMLCAMGHLGRIAEAKELCGRLLQLDPEFCLRQAALRSPMRPEDDGPYLAGLRLAGLPE